MPASGSASGGSRCRDHAVLTYNSGKKKNRRSELGSDGYMDRMIVSFSVLAALQLARHSIRNVHKCAKTCISYLSANTRDRQGSNVVYLPLFPQDHADGGTCSGVVQQPASPAPEAAQRPAPRDRQRCVTGGSRDGDGHGGPLHHRVSSGPNCLRRAIRSVHLTVRPRSIST